MAESDNWHKVKSMQLGCGKLSCYQCAKPTPASLVSGLARNEWLGMNFPAQLRLQWNIKHVIKLDFFTDLFDYYIMIHFLDSLE